jgi:hypothetical protein
MQSTKLTPSITAPGKLAIHITRGLYLNTGIEVGFPSLDPHPDPSPKWERGKSFSPFSHWEKGRG